MRRSKEEIDEDLAALQRVTRAERRRRNELRNRAALQGFSADAAIAIELEDIERRLQAYDTEYATLETLAAEADQPQAEVQYRIAVAKAWNTPEGRPTVVGAAQLELERLQLGIAPERAQVIEHAVRTDLAREGLNELSIGALLGLVEDTDGFHRLGEMNLHIYPSDGGSVSIERIDMRQTFNQISPYDNALLIVGRAVRLDPLITLHLLILMLPTTPQLEAATFGTRLLEVNKMVIYPDERSVFDGFVANLGSALGNRSTVRASAEGEG